MTQLIELDHVSRTFRVPGGTITAVDQVSLAIGGILRPSSGSLRYEGQDVWRKKGKDLSTFRRSVQLVHQDPYASLNPTRTVFQTLAAPIYRHKKAKGTRDATNRVRHLLDVVGLTPPDDFLVKYPHQLSGGQRQRVAIARALTVDPRLIVADEAVSMVDVSIRISLLNLLLGLRSEMGVSIVLITHDLAVARYFAREGRIGVMYLGRMVELAPSEALVSDPAHPYSAALIAAIPEADPRITRSKERVELRTAEVPSLLALPSGCSFHELLALSDEARREVACHVAVRERKPAAELLA